jgi:hypothetical protein
VILGNGMKINTYKRVINLTAMCPFDCEASFPPNFFFFFFSVGPSG